MNRLTDTHGSLNATTVRVYCCVVVRCQFRIWPVDRLTFFVIRLPPRDIFWESTLHDPQRLLTHITQFLLCKSAKAIISYEVKNTILNVTRGNHCVFSMLRMYDPCDSSQSSKINIQSPTTHFRHTD
jgi:hypothetical protein